MYPSYARTEDEGSVGRLVGWSAVFLLSEEWHEDEDEEKERVLLTNCTSIGMSCRGGRGIAAQLFDDIPFAVGRR